ncbi:MAG: hypothetical protein WC455_24445 [Dehalococcoidia bacterium]|jgi:hypothetical protein
MIIHLQNCSLEIAHIGTEEDIERAIIIEQALERVCETVGMFSDALAQLAEACREAVESFVRFMREPVDLVKLLGVEKK